jgi:hypothetical protein
VTLLDAARQVIDGFHASTAFEPLGGEVESIEVVWVSWGQDLEREPGIRLTWRQPGGRFGVACHLDGTS